jgi:hypothetical protein
MKLILAVCGLLSAAMFAGLVFCIVMFFKSLKLTKQQTNSMLSSNAFNEISNYIFSNGRPAQIIITLNNEIFYGPIAGQFKQVPGNMIPPMDHLQRYSLGDAFAQKYNYTSNICFGPQGQNLGTCQTGNGYLDSNADIVVSGSVATGSW